MIEWLARLLTDEAALGRNPRPEQATESIARFGVLLDDDQVTVADDWVVDAIGGRGLPSTVLLDTTCLHTTYALLSDDGPHHWLSAQSLLDLNTFVTAFVLADRVVHLQNPLKADVLPALQRLLDPTAFAVLPVESAGQATADVEELLRTLYRSGERWAQALIQPPGSDKGPREVLAVERGALVRGWSTILGVDVSVEDLLTSPNDGQPSTWASPTRMLVHALRQPDDSAGLTGEQAVALGRVREHNHRAMFNTFLAAGPLGIPYSASAARWPMRELAGAWDEGLRSTLLDLDPQRCSLVRELETYYDQRVAEALGDGPQAFHLPAFLAALVASNARLEDLRGHLVALRDLAEPLRQVLGAMDAALADPATRRRELDRIRGAVRQEAAALVRVVGGAALVVGTLAGLRVGGPPPAAWTTIAGLLQVPGLVPQRQVAAVRDQVFRRRYALFHDLGDTTRLVADQIEQVRVLWPAARGLDQLPGDLARLGALRWG